jgi:hypothetical protein
MENGWFVVCSPLTGRVVAVNRMVDPEDNKVAEATFHKALVAGRVPRKRVDCLIYDRMCRLSESMKATGKFRQVKHYAIDKLHGRKHDHQCACNPKTNCRLSHRLEGVNTMLCEQTFSWFRRYSHCFNTMRPLRHRFVVLNYLGKHNDFVDGGLASYLSPMSGIRTKGQSVPYDCNVDTAE